MNNARYRLSGGSAVPEPLSSSTAGCYPLCVAIERQRSVAELCFIDFSPYSQRLTGGGLYCPGLEFFGEAPLSEHCSQSTTSRGAPRLRVLASALACHRDLGSEASVGYRYVEYLARAYDVTVLATTPNLCPSDVRLINCSAGGECNINDVDALALARFELNQLRIIYSRKANAFDFAHRITPSAISVPSLLPALRYPTIVGPLIAAPTPPREFKSILRQAPRPRLSARLRPPNIARSMAGRTVDNLRGRAHTLAHAALILVGMEEARSQIPEGMRDRCIFLRWSGVDHDLFLPPLERPCNTPLKVLCVGRLVPYKGVELLLHALRAARQRVPLVLDIVGDGAHDYVSYLKRLAVELELGEVATFRGGVKQSELLQHYQSADIFCFPTLADTYGIALLEAMSCGCPVVVSRTGGPAELVRDDRGIAVALTHPQRFIEELAQALVSLAENPGLRSRLGANARRYVVSEHDWDRIGARLLEIYGEFTTRLKLTARDSQTPTGTGL